MRWGAIFGCVLCIACASTHNSPSPSPGAAAPPQAEPSSPPDASADDDAQLTATDASTGLAAVTTVDDTLLNQVVMPHTKEVLKCYRTSLKEHPGIEGALVYSWTVEANGGVSHLTVESGSTLKDEQTRTCVRKILEGLTFPANAQGKTTKLRIPYQFVREGRDAGK